MLFIQYIPIICIVFHRRSLAVCLCYFFHMSWRLFISFSFFWMPHIISQPMDLSCCIFRENVHVSEFPTSPLVSMATWQGIKAIGSKVSPCTNENAPRCKQAFMLEIKEWSLKIGLVEWSDCSLHYSYVGLDQLNLYVIS